jgi:hypothetical protein
LSGNELAGRNARPIKNAGSEAGVESVTSRWNMAGGVCLFLDGVAERLHQGQPREPVLAALDIAASGAKLLLGLY